MGELRETPGSVAWQLSSSAAGAACRIRQRPRTASTSARARSKSATGARQGSRWAAPESNGSSAAACQSPQFAGMSERLPSGSTTSSSRVPRRLMVRITGNERPSNGCRSRTIVNRFLEHRIGDRRIIRLIQKWLKAGVLEAGAVSVSDKGTGQGSVISPLLANIYLHYALDLWAVRWRRREATGDMVIVRYADDFIV